jgi:hypothetical protein
MTKRSAVLPTLTRFFPAVLAVMAALMVAEAVLHNRRGLAGLAGVDPFILAMEPLLMTLGYGVAVWLLRREAGSRPLLSATVAVLALGVLSVFTQGIGVPAIAVASLCGGALAALVSRRPRLVAAAA